MLATTLFCLKLHYYFTITFWFLSNFQEWFNDSWSSLDSLNLRKVEFGDNGSKQFNGHVSRFSLTSWSGATLMAVAIYNGRHWQFADCSKVLCINYRAERGQEHACLVWSVSGMYLIWDPLSCIILALCTDSLAWILFMVFCRYQYFSCNIFTVGSAELLLIRQGGEGALRRRARNWFL